MIDGSGWRFGLARAIDATFAHISGFVTRVTLQDLAVADSIGGVSSKFELSGGGVEPYTVNTWQRFKKQAWKFVSVKTVVAIGIISTALLLLVTATGLTTVHVVAMLLLMLWSSNHIIGLFVSENKPGVAVMNGTGDKIAAFAGF